MSTNPPEGLDAEFEPTPVVIDDAVIVTYKGDPE